MKSLSLYLFAKELPNDNRSVVFTAIAKKHFKRRDFQKGMKVLELCSIFSQGDNDSVIKTLIGAKKFNEAYQFCMRFKSDKRLFESNMQMIFVGLKRSFYIQNTLGVFSAREYDWWTNAEGDFNDNPTPDRLLTLIKLYQNLDRSG